MQNNDFPGLKELANTLEDVGYESVLLTYHSNSPDLFVQAIENLSNTFIKYNIAVRPYSISPEYLAMIAQSIDNLYPDRLMFNFVAGNLYEDETLEGIIHYDNSLLRDVRYRRSYLVTFLNKFLNMPVLKHQPICMIGSSDENLQKFAKQNSLMSAITYDSFMQNINTLSQNNNSLMINLPVILRPTLEEAHRAQEESVGPGNHGNNFIVGTYETLLDKIFELREYNVNNIMLGNVAGDFDDSKNHSEIKKALEVIHV